MINIYGMLPCAKHFMYYYYYNKTLEVTGGDFHFTERVSAAPRIPLLSGLHGSHVVSFTPCALPTGSQQGCEIGGKSDLLQCRLVKV